MDLTAEQNQDGSLPQVLVGRKRAGKPVVSVHCSKWGVKFCWLGHPHGFFTHNINMQRFKGSGRFCGSWFMVSWSQLLFYSLNRYSAPSTLYFDEFWCGRLEVNSETSRKTHWNLKSELLTINLLKHLQYFISPHQHFQILNWQFWILYLFE